MSQLSSLPDHTGDEKREIACTGFAPRYNKKQEKKLRVVISLGGTRNSMTPSEIKQRSSLMLVIGSDLIELGWDEVSDRSIQMPSARLP